jgi:hypothetical protein
MGHVAHGGDKNPQKYLLTISERNLTGDQDDDGWLMQW